VPAVVELAEGAAWSLQGGPVSAELLTPTGAAILAELADGVDSLPSLRVETSGYGAGGYDFPDRPNVLRAVVGETERLRRDAITVLETNLDDASPEVLGGLQETLVEVGARDVSVVPLTMKKSRPGHLVKVVVKPADAERVARRLAEETGTLGVREHGTGHRFVADRHRHTATVAVDGGRFEVGVKLARIGGHDSGADATNGSTVFDISAEYDDALAVARETGRDRKTVRKHIARGLVAPVYGPRAPRSTVVDPYKAYLRERVTFLDPEGHADGNTNPVEADAVADVVDSYLAAGLSPADIGVIAPYRAQVATVRRRVPDDVTVDTVDRFQGSSTEVIVVSFVATGSLDGPIFEDYRRANVALTRAKRGLVLVGDREALGSDDTYARMVEWAE
jgi:hypothetical protein